MTKKTYQLYGRKSYKTPLAQQAEISVAEGVDVKTAVLHSNTDDDWIELVAIPVEKMLWIIQKGKKV